MKQIRSKKLDTLRDTVDKAVKRVGGVKAEMQELTYRDWKGGEMDFPAPVREVANQLTIAVDAMRQAERLMAGLVSKAESKGK